MCLADLPYARNSEAVLTKTMQALVAAMDEEGLSRSTLKGLTVRQAPTMELSLSKSLELLYLGFT